MSISAKNFCLDGNLSRMEKVLEQTWARQIQETLLEGIIWMVWRLLLGYCRWHANFTPKILCDCVSNKTISLYQAASSNKGLVLSNDVLLIFMLSRATHIQVYGIAVIRPGHMPRHTNETFFFQSEILQDRRVLRGFSCSSRTVQHEWLTTAASHETCSKPHRQASLHFNLALARQMILSYEGWATPCSWTRSRDRRQSIKSASPFLRVYRPRYWSVTLYRTFPPASLKM